MNNDEQAGNIPDSNQKRIPWGKLFLLVLFLAGGYFLYSQYGELISLNYLAGREEELKQLFHGHYFFTILVAILIYVLVAGLSLPGAVPLTVAYAWFFGFWLGMVVVSFGSTGGAVVSFLLSRYLFRDWVQARMSRRFDQVNKMFEREGAFYLFTLRLIPLVPFFVINAVMGLTRIRLVTYWWVSQLGMLPGTAAYVYAGSTVPSLQTLAEEGVGQVLNWQLITAFVILGLLPITLRKLMQIMGWLPTVSEDETQTETPSSNS
ncbi:MAG: TVP38/TMEM64 family protein [Planctomycetaceae bacterium]|nr:TVP38/TMEM64 family protein [Planctomycetaceae bacterium]